MGAGQLVIWGARAIAAWAPKALGAARAVVLPAAEKSSWTAIRLAMAGRAKLLYGALPSSVQTVLGSVLLMAGIEGVTAIAHTWSAAGKDDTAFAQTLINMAAQGVNPDLVAPPDYVDQLRDDRLKAMFANAREAYQSYLASHGDQGDVQIPTGLGKTSSTISNVELVRVVANMLGAHSTEHLMSVQDSLKKFLAMSGSDLAQAGLLIRASGGRL